MSLNLGTVLATAAVAAAILCLKADAGPDLLLFSLNSSGFVIFTVEHYRINL